MRNATFKKINRIWTARPFQGWEYQITECQGFKRLSFNGQQLATSDRVEVLKDVANDHLHTNIRGESQNRLKCATFVSRIIKHNTTRKI